ncbi:uracil-DNA glycosylase [Pseudidiomarina salinarum]|uniref:Uracil-DNA glycosylase n=1 Tax=Pseudidiomarina salinarum TaxID=435908 RepID=A0A094JFJ2_9GAMM|nr:uracil-DNA glycosylase [Pseudidiomarina salinarum]KFZ31311.1 uracil-DNA glycosylase [Pseudidiomarina salinarum]RUO70938.1 uracil-DNA glycosylase [Pseudidiomarina salinarum]
MKDWSDLIGAEKQKQYFKDLLDRVGAERAAGKTIYPPPDKVFNAFKLTPLHKVNVVIIGQDPYHGPGQAHGLCFSVPKGVKKPPSLRNIFKALKHDFPDYEEPTHGNLEHWAEQGVLLLNAVLTVEQGKAHSHVGWGWERFTDKVIEQIDRHCEGVVFLLWGNYAQKKADFVDGNRHHVLTTVHPSPLSAHRGFLTCGHFAETNRLLDEPIRW